MIRVKDAEKSLKFYQEVLGMSLIREGGNPDAGFTLYFLGYTGDNGVPKKDGTTSDREGLLELTWNHGTEKDESFSYHNGNKEPQGFGHICESSSLWGTFPEQNAHHRSSMISANFAVCRCLG